MLLLALALVPPATAQARERVAVLPPFQETELALAGERVAWVERAPGIPEHRTLPPLRVQIAGAGESPRTMATFPGVPFGAPSGYHQADVEASTTHVAVARVAVAITPFSRTDSHTSVLVDELWAGPAGGELKRIAACEPGADHPALANNFDVSAGRVVRETCEGGRGLVLHDLTSGAERAIARGGAGGRHVSLAGRYLAWEEHEGAGRERTLVVHDVEAGTDARRIAQPHRKDMPRVSGFYVQDDGKQLDPQFEPDFAHFRPIVYAAAEHGGDRLLRPMNASRLSGDRTLEVHRYGQRADVTVNSLDGTRAPVARVDQYRLGETDFDGDRVAWSETRCGATTLFVQVVGEPLSVSRSTLGGRCARVALPPSATVSRAGALRLPLRCVEMRRCAGRLKLSLEDGTRVLSRGFDFRRKDRGTVLARLRSRAERVTAAAYDRDGFLLGRRTVALRHP